MQPQSLAKSKSCVGVTATPPSRTQHLNYFLVVPLLSVVRSKHCGQLIIFFMFQAINDIEHNEFENDSTNINLEFQTTISI